MIELAQRNKPIKVKRTDYNQFTFYSFTQAKQNFKTGEYEYLNIPLKFKKDVSLNDGQVIYINKWYLEFYKKGNEVKLIVFITNFETVEEHEANSQKEIAIDYFSNELEENFDEFNEDLGF